MEEEHKSSFGTRLNIQKEQIAITFKGVVGKVLPTAEGEETHNYTLTLVRQGLVDLIGHLYATLMVYDTVLKREKGIENSAYIDVREIIDRILEDWKEENDRLRAEEEGNIIEDSTPKEDTNANQDTVRESV